jgi:hypothetical protein
VDLKAVKLPKIAIGWRRALIVAGVAAAAALLVFVGWTLFIDYTEGRQVAAFGSHVAASEADLFLVSGKVSSHIGSRPDYPSVAECDASMREFAALAEYGRGVTAYHRQIVGADRVPKAYVEAQSAYIRALDHLNRAFSFWSSAAGAYDTKAYAAAGDHLAGADLAWKDYIAAIDDYEQELRAAEEGEEALPA